MRKYQSHISLILVTGLLIGLFHQTGTIIHFYLNQDEIAAEHCVNKDNPEKKNCHGQCHLKAELKATTPDQKKNNEGIPTPRTSVFVFLFASTPTTFLVFETKNHSPNHHEEPGNTQTFHAEIFHPPQIVV